MLYGGLKDFTILADDEWSIFLIFQSQHCNISITTWYVTGAEGKCKMGEGGHLAVHPMFKASYRYWFWNFYLLSRTIRGFTQYCHVAINLRVHRIWPIRNSGLVSIRRTRLIQDHTKCIQCWTLFHRSNTSPRHTSTTDIGRPQESSRPICISPYLSLCIPQHLIEGMSHF